MVDGIMGKVVGGKWSGEATEEERDTEHSRGGIGQILGEGWNAGMNEKLEPVLLLGELNGTTSER